MRIHTDMSDNTQKFNSVKRSTRKRWKMVADSVDREAVNAIARELHVLQSTAFLLYIRGYRTPAEARDFLTLDSARLRDPYLIRDMDKAVTRIITALEEGEKIAIYGDYDVDGVTSVATVYLYLKSRGADVVYYIPSRSGEGYGVSESALKALADDGVKLVVTVDTGITANAETEYAKSIGVDIIVTDHHECHSNLPNACAVVNPRRPDSVYPFRELAGVGVTFKFVCAIERALTGKNCDSELIAEYSDLVATGTVADVMPLLDENRLIVSEGLKRMQKSPRPGLLALLEAAGVSSTPDRNGKCRRIDSTLIGFVIAPRLNAAGRLRNATDALELLLASSPSKANALALSLCAVNTERQEQERAIAECAYAKIEAEHDFENDKVIVLSADGWHHGVIGIVASRITEKYNLPSILISFDGDTGKGSGRSVKGLNLVDALSSCKDMLLKFGGHELAAGLSIDRSRLDEFKRAINEYAATHLSSEELVSTIDIDAELFDGDLTLRQASELRLLEPYGVSNPSPLFVTRSAYLSDLSAIGAGKHSRMTLKIGASSVSAVCFGVSPHMLDVVAGDVCDVVYTLSINEFLNNKNVQLIVRDIRLPDERAAQLDEQNEIYESLRDGIYAGNGDYLPTHEDFAVVYRYIRREASKNNGCVRLRTLSGGSGINNIVKTHFILDIFNEANLISVENVKDDLFRVSVNPIGIKVCLERCGIYRKLRRTLRHDTDA